MKKIFFKSFIILTLALVLIIISTTYVQAAYQSNLNTHYKKTDLPANWIKIVRNIEKTGQALGLKETIGTSLVATSESNDLDSHMMKSTEYGAIAILSASGYGNSKKLQESTIKSTTGNKSGLYFSGANWEFVAGGNSKGSIFSGVSSIYYNSYTDSTGTAKVGDALGTSSTANPGCAGWHSASFSSWNTSNSNTSAYYIRGGGGLFAFKSNDSYYGVGTFKISPTFSRGVIVCGEGL